MYMPYTMYMYLFKYAHHAQCIVYSQTLNAHEIFVLYIIYVQ